MKAELTAAKAQASAGEAAGAAAQAVAARAAGKREAEVRALRAAVRATGIEREAQAAAARLLADTLAALRQRPPAAHALLILSTAPNASLRSAAGSSKRAADIVTRQPWSQQASAPSLDALLTRAACMVLATNG